MAVTSGTKRRLRYKRPGAAEFVPFINATTMSINRGTKDRKLIHKDNEGDHDEGTPDGKSTTSTVSFYHEPNSTYKDILEAWNAGETIELEWHDGVAGGVLESQSAYVSNMTDTAAVRETVSATISFTHTGNLSIGQVPA